MIIRFEDLLKVQIEILKEMLKLNISLYLSNLQAYVGRDKGNRPLGLISRIGLSIQHWK
jgi:hypothetical protein